MFLARLHPRAVPPRCCRLRRRRAGRSAAGRGAGRAAGLLPRRGRAGPGWAVPAPLHLRAERRRGGSGRAGLPPPDVASRGPRQSRAGRSSRPAPRPRRGRCAAPGASPSIAEQPQRGPRPGRAHTDSARGPHASCGKDAGTRRGEPVFVCGGAPVLSPSSRSSPGGLGKGPSRRLKSCQA